MRSESTPPIRDLSRRLTRRLLPFFLLLLGALAMAPAEARAQGQDEPATEQETPTPSGPLHSSPRAAMEAFLGGMQRYELGRAPEDLELALSALEVGDEGKPGEAEQTARELYDTLNRVGRVDLGAFGGRGFEGDVQRVRLRFAPWRRSPEIWLELRRVAAGSWQISASTLDDVPGWWEEVRDLPIATDVEELLEETGEGLPPLQWLHWRIDRSMPESMTIRWLGIALYQWLALAALVLACVVLDRVIRFLTGRLLARIAKGEQLWIQKSEFAGFERPLGIFLSALTFELALPVIGLEARVRGLIGVALGFVVSVAGVWAAFRLVDVCAAFLRARARQTASRFDDMLVPLLRRTLKILVGVIGIVYFSSRLTEDITGIVAGLSIGSLAVGFAAKDSIENLFGTFTVLLDKPYQLGDWITVGDIDGTVEEVGFRSTRVRTFYNSIITVPNSRFISAHVDNWGRRRYRRIKTTLSLTYDTPPESIEAFCEGVRELIREHPYTRKDSYHVYLNQFAASSLDVLLYCFVETPDWSTELRERHRLFNDILRLAGRLGVEFAFPTQTVHLAGPEDLEHPGRPAGVEEALERGRAAGREVAKSGLAPFGGAKPPPVVID